MESVANIETLDQLAEVLSDLGYDAVVQANSVAVKIGHDDAPFVCVIVPTEGNTRFRFVCELARLSDLDSDGEVFNAFMFEALKLTSDLDPYAVDFVAPGEDDDTIEELLQTKITLLDSIPIGDLQASEVADEMEALLRAIKIVEPALRAALPQSSS